MAYSGPYIPNQQAETDVANQQSAVAIRAVALQVIQANPAFGKPTNAWARLAVSGAAKVQKLVTGAVVSTAKTGASLINQGYQEGKQVVDTAKMTEAAHSKNPTAFSNANKQSQKDYQGFKNKGGLLNAGTATTKQEAQQGTAKGAEKIAGAAVATGSLLIPGGGKAVEEGGSFLLKQMGEQGVKELATKAGVEVGSRSTEDIAKELATSKTGKFAVKALSQGSTVSKVLHGAKTGAIAFGSYNAGSEAAQGGSVKQVAESGAKGAAAGAALGVGGAIAGKAASRALGRYSKTPISADDLKATAGKHQAAEKMATEKGLPTGTITPKTKELAAGKVSEPRELPAGKKIAPKTSSKVTVVDKPAETVSKEEVETAHKEATTNLGEQYVNDIGAAKRKAQEEAISGKTDIATAYKSHVDTANQKYEQGLSDAEKTHQTNLKTIGTEKTPAVTHEEERGFQVGTTSKTATVVNKRLTQLDRLISAAQKNGTTKSAEELRSLMRERSSLQDVVSGKKTVEDIKTDVKDPVTVQKLTEAASKDSGKTADLQVAAKSAEKTASTTPEPEKTSLGKSLGESGAVAPGKAAEDVGKVNASVKEYVARNQKGIKVSGDIQKDAQAHEAVSKQRLVDSAKILKKLGDVSKEDKKAVYAYREAKAAHQTLPKLTENQKNLHDTVTHIVEATNKNKQELVDLKAPGYGKDTVPRDASAGNHRIALGKGSALERFGMGRQDTPLSARSLRTTAASGKARVYHAVVDEDGNRSVVAIKNVSVKQGLRSVSKGKFVNQINEDGTTTRLGKITPGEMKSGSFTGKDGKTYKLSQATTGEIGKATGQKYVEDPLTSAVLDYHETTNALESSRMLEGWKKSPTFDDIALKHGEGVPPKGWKTTRLPQMQGYSFEPRVAEALDDVYGNIRDKAELPTAINHVLRNTMVAIPIRHNLNEIGFYFTDRGLTSLANPMAWKRGADSLVKAVNDVMNTSEDYRKAVSTGFNFMYSDDKAFANQIAHQTKGMIFDDQSSAERLAADARTTVTNIRQAWNKVQHTGVWAQQDILNMARINERMAKGASLEDAAAQTQRFNPQYRVPSRVAGSRVASQLLRNNNLLFFGSYHYDQWKTLANTIGDAVGKSGSKPALEAWDKLAAMTVGVYATYALIDKGLQNFSGNSNAYTKPFGNLDLPDELYQLATGKKDISSVAQSQIFPSAGLSAVAQVFENRDFYTGKNIRDPNMPANAQIAQIGKWLESQLPTTQQVSNAKKGGSVGSAILAIAGTRFPSNSAATNKINSLKYDTLPNVQTVAKKQAQSGNISGAQQTISQYDSLLLAATKQALKQSGKPIPPDDQLIKSLKKQQYYYAPKDKTIKKWSTERPTSIINKL